MDLFLNPEHRDIIEVFCMCVSFVQNNRKYNGVDVLQFLQECKVNNILLLKDIKRYFG